MASKQRIETRLHVVHCAATTARQDIGKRTINKQHLNDGVYSDSGMTGYHLVIRRSGLVEIARPLPLWGQHALGWNDKSIATCLVGGARKARAGEEQEWPGRVPDNNFLSEQLVSLSVWHSAILMAYPTAILVPHSALNHRSCPSFDVWRWQQEEFGYNDRLRWAEYKAALDAEADERKDEG